MRVCLQGGAEAGGGGGGMIVGVGGCGHGPAISPPVMFCH